MTTIFEPLAPCDYTVLPDAVKNMYEPTTRLNGAGVPMHFPRRWVIVFCDPKTERSLNMYFDVNVSNWKTFVREAAFHFTSEAQADLACRAMNAEPGRYGDYLYKVEPAVVYRCACCFAAGGQPHKPNCTDPHA